VKRQGVVGICFGREGLSIHRGRPAVVRPKDKVGDGMVTHIGMPVQRDPDRDHAHTSVPVFPAHTFLYWHGIATNPGAAFGEFPPVNGTCTADYQPRSPWFELPYTHSLRLPPLHHIQVIPEASPCPPLPNCASLRTT
jgi:hypothetical protein